MYKTICVPVSQTEQIPHSIAAAEVWTEFFEARAIGLQLSRDEQKKNRVSRMLDTLPKAHPLQETFALPEGTNGTSTNYSIPFEKKAVSGATLQSLVAKIEAEEGDLVILDAIADGESDEGIGATCTRLLRRLHVDTLVVKEEFPTEGPGSDAILVCVDGSQQCYAGLLTAIDLAKKLNKRIEAVAVYDPYLHYTLFNGIVSVLSEEASSVFKFKDQEKLHEEIIDTGLAKIYQAHLEVAQRVAHEHDAEIAITLLDGKAFQKVLRHAQVLRPWLMIMGRIGVHSEMHMDIGATAENLLAAVPCNVLVTSRTYIPPVDVQASASIEWTPAAQHKMERVPVFVKGVATTAILRWAMERGHSVITPSVINAAMGDLLPPGAAQAMGYVAEEVAINKDRLAEGSTFICRQCGHAVRDIRPALCVVCKSSSDSFEQINREKLESLGSVDKGDLIEEEMFDGKKLKWVSQAKGVLRRVPSGYQRRRTKARIEKTARVRGFETVSYEFAVEMMEQEMADTAYLTPRGETLNIEVKDEERADDSTPKARDESPLPWTDAAWKRICRVPEGFMRDMTREKVEEFAAKDNQTEVNLALCEEGIAEGRRMMADMMGKYKTGGSAQQAVRQEVKTSEPAVSEPTATEATEATEVTEAKCPVDTAEQPTWTDEAQKTADDAVKRVTEIGKFDEDRAQQLTAGVAEERARENRLDQIGEAFMQRLGKQLGYGHPLAQKTSEYEFTWTPEAEERLKDVPDFCREMTRWRVEWTAVKKELGFVITPEIMDVKFDMWGEVSDSIQENNEPMDWAPETMARLERIPEFIKGQVIQSVEGNARATGVERVTNEVLDRVIKKWIDTGDFHEGKYGYK
jgi:nucleotide-binding universal stress UspA family protein